SEGRWNTCPLSGSRRPPCSRASSGDAFALIQGRPKGSPGYHSAPAAVRLRLSAGHRPAPNYSGFVGPTRGTEGEWRCARNCSASVLVRISVPGLGPATLSLREWNRLSSTSAHFEQPGKEGAFLVQ